MPTKGYITIEDYNHEKSVMSPWLNSIGYVGATFESVQVDLDEIKDAVALITLGVIRHVGLNIEYPEDEFSVVADENAQRESKWLVVMRDTAQFLDIGSAVANPGYGRLFTLEVPVAKLDTLMLDNGYADLTAPDMATFVASIEANARSPWNNDPELLHTVSQSVVEIRHVGRNI